MNCVGADDAHVEGRGGRARLAHHALEAVLEVGRRHLTTDRRLEHDALAQVEGVRLAVGRDAAVVRARHLGRQARDELGARLAGRVRVLQEALVDVVLDLPVDDVPRHGGSRLDGSVRYDRVSVPPCLG